MRLLHVFAFLPGIMAVIPAHAQVYTAADLSKVLQQIQKDSMQQTSRMAAMEFHKLINVYRLENGSDTLAWNDTLWLAALNHTRWMSSNRELSHDERPGTDNFTGASPGTRFTYVAKDQCPCSWSGENALYNYSSEGENKWEIARSMAEHSFVQWKNSPGHNKNMLAKGSRAHGVAFEIADGIVWSTDLFGSCSYQPPPRTITVTGKPTSPDAGIETTGQPVAEAKPSTQKRFSTKNSTEDLMESLYTTTGARRSRTMERAALHHAQYMASTKSVTHTERKNKRYFTGATAGRRVLKASHGFAFLSAKRVTESVAMIEADATAFDPEAVAKLILEGLDKEQRKPGKAAAVGFGIVIKRVKNDLKIYVVREEKIEKEAGDFD